MPRSICVFSSSSDIIERDFFEVAAELGRAIGARGDTLVYGGCDVGLMGAVAHAAHQENGQVIGVIPSFIEQRGLGYQGCQELIVTRDMRERKATMEARADAFIALPGGFGTLEEMLEIITLKQLQQHTKPIVFLNHAGFYDPLTALFEHMFEHKFAKPVYREMYYLAPDVTSAMQYIEVYVAPEFENKWFNTAEV